MEEPRDERGRLLPGHGGMKPKGAKSELRKKVNEFVTEKWDELPDLFNSLKPKDKLLFFSELLPYCLPKLKQIDLEITNAFAVNQVDLTRLSPEALNEVLSLQPDEDEQE